MNNDTLSLLQALPLKLKIAKTKLRIEEWVRYYGIEGVYISFSGGKDSTVLAHIVRQLYPSIPLVYCDTGLEYPEIKEFVRSYDNVVYLRPKKSFKQVIEEIGYPIISKENSQYLYEIRTGTEKLRNRRIYGDSKGRFKLPKKYHYLIDAPFKISHRCCAIMKKNPIKCYERKTKRVAIVGTMADESSLRKSTYLKNGCNSFDGKRPMSTPLGFWTEQDILAYIKSYKLPIASVYGDIVEVDGKLKTTECDRTGCIYCCFGVHLEDDKQNRFLRLERTHPKLHEYCINNLGLGKVLDFIGVKYKK